MHKKILLLLVALVIIVCGFYFYKNYKVTEVKFSGMVMSVTGDILNVHGTLSTETPLPSNIKLGSNFPVKVTSSTVYKKVEIFLPTAEMLKAQGKTTFNMQDAVHKESAGSLDGIKNLPIHKPIFVNITLKFHGNDFVNPEAKEVTYQVIVEPK